LRHQNQTNVTDVASIFLDSLIPDFYEELGLDNRKFIRVGQICRTHVFYSHENQELWRAIITLMQGRMIRACESSHTLRNFGTFGPEPCNALHL
jgi:hypothetical protein